MEWAIAILNGIKRFAEENNDVAVFGKILKNEIDEEFRYIQIQVKTTIADLLKNILRQKFPVKSEKEILKLSKQKANGFLDKKE